MNPSVEIMELRKHAFTHVPLWVVVRLCGGGNRNSEYAVAFPRIRRLPEARVE